MHAAEKRARVQGSDASLPLLCAGLPCRTPQTLLGHTAAPAPDDNFNL